MATNSGAQPPGRPEDLRASERRDAEFEITAQSENNFYRGFSENISGGGLFFETYGAHNLGDLMTVRFSLPGSETPIEAAVVVRWLRPFNPINDTPQGIGVQFVRLDPEDQRRIEHFTKKREPLFFDDE